MRDRYRYCGDLVRVGESGRAHHLVITVARLYLARLAILETVRTDDVAALGNF